MESYNQKNHIIGPKIQTVSINTDHLPQKNPGKKSRWKKIGVALTLFLVVVLLGAGAAIAYFSEATKSIFKNQPSQNIISQVGGLFQAKLQGENEGQINVLLLGIGGENHDGGYLSDSIVLAQIHTDSKQVVLTSIPRDLVINIPRLQGRKINAALAEGYLKNHNWQEGISLATQSVESVTGLQIPYTGIIDFQGFTKIINQLGGVDVQIVSTFTDNQYPDGKDGYIAPVTFKAGPEHMTGERALIFARSRHAGGSEGSDFARSKRQQLVIEAVKKKVLSGAIITKISNLNQILQTTAEHIHTNLNQDELWRMFTLTKGMDIVAMSLTPDTGLICPKIQEATGAYILDLCPGKTEDDLSAFFKNTKYTAKANQETSRILLAAKNAFNTKASEISREMENSGAVVTRLNYDEIQPEENIFYQLNSKPETVNYLKHVFGATEVVLPPPSIKIDREKYDIIIVLGNQNSSAENMEF